MPSANTFHQYLNPSINVSFQTMKLYSTFTMTFSQPFSIFNFTLNMMDFTQKIVQFYFVEFKHFSESTWRIQILPLLLLHWVSCWFSLSLFTQFQPTILLLILQTPMDSWISAIPDVWSNSSSTPSMVSKIPTLPTIGDKKRWVQNFGIQGMTIKMSFTYPLFFRIVKNISIFQEFHEREGYFRKISYLWLFWSQTNQKFHKMKEKLNFFISWTSMNQISI